MIILYGSAIIFGIMFRKSRICSAYILSVMYLTSAFCIQNDDYRNYENGYNLIASGQSTNVRYWGYGILIKICSSMGLNFQQYRMLFYLLVISILFISILFFTEKANFVLALYMAFSFCTDIIQMKSFIAYTIELFALSILLREEIKNNILRYIVFFVLSFLASLMHFSAAYFILAAVVYIFMRKKKNIGRDVFVFSALGTLFVYFGGLEIVAQIMNQIGILGDMEYLSNWFEKRTHFGFILGFIWVFVIAYCFSGRQVRCQKPCMLSDKIEKYGSTVFLTLPVLVLNLQYTRLLRPYMILLFCVFADRFQRKETRRSMIGNALVASCVSLSAIFEFRSIDGGIIHIITNNRAFNGSITQVITNNQFFGLWGLR